MYSNIASDLTDDCWKYCSFAFMIEPDVTRRNRKDDRSLRDSLSNVP